MKGTVLSDQVLILTDSSIKQNTLTNLSPNTLSHTHAQLLKPQGHVPSRSPREAKVRTGRTLSGQREVMLGERHQLA